jgi:hypothetical protein
MTFQGRSVLERHRGQLLTEVAQRTDSGPVDYTRLMRRDRVISDIDPHSPSLPGHESAGHEAGRRTIRQHERAASPSLGITLLQASPFSGQVARMQLVERDRFRFNV